MSTRTSFTWSEFSAGDVTGMDERKMANGFVEAHNVMVSESGWIYPRRGLVDITPTGVPSGRITGMGLGFGVRGLWYFVGKNGYAFAPDGSYGNTSIGALDAVPTRPLSHNGRFITNYGDKSYDWNGTTLTALTGSPGGAAITEWNGFLVVGNLSGNTNRIKFSAQYDYNTWPALNYIDISTIGFITALVSFRDRVVIGMSDGTWWSFTGDPENADAQRVTQLTNVRAHGPSSWIVASVSNDYLLTTDLGGAIRLGPSVAFDGANFIDTLGGRPSHLIGTSNASYSDTAANSLTYSPNAVSRSANEAGAGVGMIADHRGGHLLSVNNGRAVSVRRGVPTGHWFRYPVAGYVADFPNCFYLTDGGTDGSNTRAAKFFRWDESDLPQTAYGGADAVSNAYVNGQFKLPTLTMPDRNLMSVKCVEVEWEAFPNATNYGFEVTAYCGNYPNSSEIQRATLSSNATAIGATGPTNPTIEVPALAASRGGGGVMKLYPNSTVPGQFGKLQLGFTRVRGLFIKSVTVHFDATAPRF